ncbi:MAG: hypothetical protein ACI4S9_08500 [Christensenellales bacterium]
MKLSKKLLEKAKSAKSAEELLALAKTVNVELTEDEAVKAFAELNKTGELSDEELDNVTGGCSPSDPPKYNIGDSVMYYYMYSYSLKGNEWIQKTSTIIDITADGSQWK